MAGWHEEDGVDREGGERERERQRARERERERERESGCCTNLPPPFPGDQALQEDEEEDSEEDSDLARNTLLNAGGAVPQEAQKGGSTALEEMD